MRREIVATQLTNSMINGGSDLIVRIADQTGASAAAIAAAFAAVRGSYDLIAFNTEIDLSITGFLEGCSSSSIRPCRTCCSTVWSGSCATST